MKLSVRISSENIIGTWAVWIWWMDYRTIPYSYENPKMDQSNTLSSCRCGNGECLYILYHRLHPQKAKVELPNFRTEVAESRCKSRMALQKRSAGRPSSASPRASPKLTKRTYLPTEDVRYDQIGHWCRFRDRSGKKQCKFPKWKSETQAYCVKCNQK